jgi:hypothetical protein
MVSLRMRMGTCCLLESAEDALMRGDKGASGTLSGVEYEQTHVNSWTSC